MNKTQKEIKAVLTKKGFTAAWQSDYNVFIIKKDGEMVDMIGPDRIPQWDRAYPSRDWDRKKEATEQEIQDWIQQNK
jgi:hypothetical protein